jgi:hypothetical protein
MPNAGKCQTKSFHARFFRALSVTLFGPPIYMGFKFSPGRKCAQREQENNLRQRNLDFIKRLILNSQRKLASAEEIYSVIL